LGQTDLRCFDIMPKLITPTKTLTEITERNGVELTTSTLRKSVVYIGNLLLRSARRAISYTGFTQANSSSAQQTSKLELLKNRLLDEHGLRKSAQAELRAELLERQSKLGLEKDLVLFSFREQYLPKHTKEADDEPVLIVKPKDNAKLVLADLYRKKYGIEIVVETGGWTSEYILARMETMLERSKGKPVGLILQTPQGKSTKRKDHGGHVTPLLVAKSSNTISMIAIDSANASNESLNYMLGILQEKRCNFVVVANVKQARQADPGSCHTDALQILKDSLLEQRKHSRPLLSNLFEHSCVKSDFDIGLYSTTINLPPHLMKTSQRNAVFDESYCNTAVLNKTFIHRSKSKPAQNMLEHRARYSRVDKYTRKSINYFLIVKAFHNADKVLMQLESLGSQAERKKYLKKLQIHNNYRS
jgi:hypothetical protein